MNKDDVLALIKEAKELGVASIKIGDIEVQFTNNTEKRISDSQIDTSSELEAKDLVAPPGPLDELSDEEILFWSCDHGVELAAAKIKEHMDKLQRMKEDVEREEITRV